MIKADGIVHPIPRARLPQAPPTESRCAGPEGDIVGRFTAFKNGVTKLIEQCKQAGVKEVYLIPPADRGTRGP